MSALTSLLVRDDAVSVRQIEDALQRQVMDGGDLDTALLEQGALPENVLIAYRAVSEGARPASRAEVMNAGAATRALVSPQLAASLRVTPVSHDDENLVVATHRPLTAAQVAELSEHTGRRVEWRITSELRVHAALQRFYGQPLPKRFSALLGKVDAQPAGELVHIEALRDAPPPSNGQELMPGFDETEDFESVLESAFERVSGAPPRERDSFDDATRPLGGRLGKVSNDDMRARSAQTEQLGSVPGADPRSARARGAAPRAALGPNPRPRPAVQLPQGPLSAEVAQKALETAQERDDVMEVFFRFARQYFDSTLLLSIKGERLRGVQAHNLTTVVDVRDVSVPILRGGAVDDVVRTLLPRVVDLSRKDEDRVLGLAMKRLQSQPSALIPICIKRRVVSIVYGDRSGERVQLDELGALLELSAHVTRAFERIIRTRKALGLNPPRAPERERVRERELQHAPTQRSIQLPLAPASSVASALADAALLAARSEDALASLGVGRPPPTPPPPRDNARAVKSEALDAERHVTPSPVAGAAAAPRFFSKPPPGTGRYRSVPSREMEAITGAAREPAQTGEDTQPLRSSRRPSMRATQAAAIATTPQPRADRAPVPVSKPAPGIGSYYSQGGSPERISVRPAPMPEQVSSAKARGKQPTQAERLQRQVAQAPAPYGSSEQAAGASAADQAEHASADPGELATPAPEAVARTEQLPPASSTAQPHLRLGAQKVGYTTQPQAHRVERRVPVPAEQSETGAAAGAPENAASAPTREGGTRGMVYARAGRTIAPVARAVVGADAAAPARAANAAGADARRGAAGEAPDAGAAFGIEAGTAAVRVDAGATAGIERGPVLTQAAEPAQPAALAAPATQASPNDPAAALLEQLCKRQISEDLPEVEALRALGEPALALLIKRFPGPLWFDRRRAHAKVPAGRDISPIARALHAFGEQGLPRVASALRSKDAETRYYATLLACDGVHKDLLDPLLERLFDEDPQIRLLVRDVLPRYRRLPGFAQVTQRLCTQALDDSAPLRTRLAAIDAIGVLRDASCVPALIELITHADKQISVPAHRALSIITCQDFGKSAKKWRSWFESNEYRNRVEWLIEGLMHSDQTLRASAGLELQKLTQVYYGYVAAASKRDREQAQKRYWDWWRAEGRQKF